MGLYIGRTSAIKVAVYLTGKDLLILVPTILFVTYHHAAVGPVGSTSISYLNALPITLLWLANIYFYRKGDMSLVGSSPIEPDQANNISHEI